MGIEGEFPPIARRFVLVQFLQMWRQAILISFSLAGALFSTAATPSPSVLTNCVEIRQAIAHFQGTPIPFDITARSLSDHPRYSFSVLVEDSTGTAFLNSGGLPYPENLRPGNVVHAAGVVCRWVDGRVVTDCTTFEIVAPGKPPTAISVTAADIIQGRVTNAMVKVSGRIKDVFHDDIDPRFIFFTIMDQTGILYAALAADDADDRIFDLIGATVSITGLMRENTTVARPFQNQLLSLNNMSQVDVVASPPHDPFDDPTLRPLPTTYTITQTAQDRVLSRGQVVARWQDRFFLLKGEDGRFLTVENADKAMPSPGECVDVIGTPSANFYQLHLLHSIWRKANCVSSMQALSADRPIDTSIRELLTDDNGKRQIKINLHGRTIRIIGDIKSAPASCEFGERLFVQCGDFVAPVEIGDIRGSMHLLSPGCRVSVTGTCIMNITSVSAATPFPRISGFFIVPRSDADICVLQRPSWWTPARLLGVIALLMFVLLGSLALNIALHRLAAKKGRDLAAESIALAESEIKSLERTRLAVELHDSIAQNLTGAAMEIRAASHSREDGEDVAAGHLGIALKTIDSCRGELRNCIWDLRNQALEKNKIDEAIRLTLQPILGAAHLTVRFNVSRNLFTDHTIHAVLCIIRELAINSIRHGHATSIKVAGAIENGHLLFSVRDNGCGYDAANVPGMRDGHFGLQGIRERIRPYNGLLAVTSEAGRGTKTSIDIKLPHGAQP